MILRREATASVSMLSPNLWTFPQTIEGSDELPVENNSTGRGSRLFSGDGSEYAKEIVGTFPPCARISSYLVQSIISRKGRGSRTFISKLETATAAAEERFAIDPKVSSIGIHVRTFSHSVAKVTVLT
jgi:hypothetical protein